MALERLVKIVDKRKKRVGRGGGSGKGFHTSGRGQKGQTSRAGSHRRRGFGSEESSFIKTFPRINGNKQTSKNAAVVAIRISKLLQKEITEVDAAVLAKISKGSSFKLVGDTDYASYDLSKVVVKEGIAVSKSLKEKIIAAGGKVAE